MDQYITGSAIRSFREAQHLTQAQLAELLCVSDKAISRWETGRGYPDITLLEPLAAALHVSVTALLSGQAMINRNTASNMLRSSLYVCPVCGNVLHAFGDASVSCCGISLPALQADDMDDAHSINCEQVEDELYLTIDHDMTKTHYISFLAYVTGDRFELIKLYPEGNAEARIKLRGTGILYCYCNRHGLMKQRINRAKAAPHHLPVFSVND